MDLKDRQTLTKHVAWMRRMTENSRRSHGWTFDAEISALQRVLDEGRADGPFSQANLDAARVQHSRDRNA